MKLLRVLVPDDWREAIEKRRGSMSVSEFVRRGIERMLDGEELSEIEGWGGIRGEIPDDVSGE